MSLRHLTAILLLVAAAPEVASAQSSEDAPTHLFLELNAVQDVGEACRLTFLAHNETGSSIDQAVFETVIFDTLGGVVSLSLFDFRDLPLDRPRVRQFDLPGMACDTVGRALINGANSCIVDGVESAVCNETLMLGSRLEVELLG
jgi:hypothetical protein